MITSLDFFTDPNLAGSFFSDPSWDTWKKIIPEIEHRRESYGILGRGCGKSRIGASLTVWAAACRDYSEYLAPGQMVTSMILSGDRRQAREDFLYAEGLVDSIPMLARMVINRTKESLEFSNRTRIEVMTSSYAKVRGYTIGFAFCDEIAFWPQDDSANPDTEIITALKPGLARVKNSILFCASSPYARRGVLWKARKDSESWSEVCI